MQASSLVLIQPVSSTHVIITKKEKKKKKQQKEEEEEIKKKMKKMMMVMKPTTKTIATYNKLMVVNSSGECRLYSSVEKTKHYKETRTPRPDIVISLHFYKVFVEA